MPVDLGLALAIKEFEESFKRRSFSGRHPELGKMINCRQCGRRHRSSEKHKAVPVVEPKLINIRDLFVEGAEEWPILETA